MRASQIDVETIPNDLVAKLGAVTVKEWARQLGEATGEDTGSLVDGPDQRVNMKTLLEYAESKSLLGKLPGGLKAFARLFGLVDGDGEKKAPTIKPEPDEEKPKKAAKTEKKADKKPEKKAAKPEKKAEKKPEKKESKEVEKPQVVDIAVLDKLALAIKKDEDSWAAATIEMRLNTGRNYWHLAKQFPRNGMKLSPNDKKVTSLAEYCEKHKLFDILSHTQIRQYAKLSEKLLDDAGKIPKDLYAACLAVGSHTKIQELSPLPDPIDVINNGFHLGKKVLTLQEMSVDQIKETVQQLINKDKPEKKEKKKEWIKLNNKLSSTCTRMFPQLKLASAKPRAPKNPEEVKNIRAARDMYLKLAEMCDAVLKLT